MPTIEATILFLLPCWGINVCLNVFKFIPGIKAIDRPLDNHKRWRGKPILGQSTTIIGLPVACLAGIVWGLFFTTLTIGLVTGLTVFFGHALGSFIKRRFNVPSGAFLPIIDHGDYIFLTGIVFLVFGRLTWEIFLLALIINYFIHPLLAFIGYKLKLRSNPL